MAARHDPDTSRNSLPVSPVHDRGNVFSDDYAESFAADDYADSQDGLSIRRSPSIRSLASERRQSTSHEPDFYTPTSPSLPRSHNSISKAQPQIPYPPAQDSPANPFSDHHDESVTLAFESTPRNSGYAATAHRTLSSSSFAGSQSPASIHEGPSHPYAMYPQALSMSRTPSVATASTRPLSLNNTGNNRGPAHPYDSFAQTVPADATIPVQSTIPVGFPGANSASYRRMGPEGEEQDIIGADGHAEQLPPYSRYPEEVHLKSNTLSALPPIGETSPTNTAAATSSAQDARSSRMNLPLVPSSQRPESIRSRSSNDGTGLSEKSWGEKSWRERRNSRYCGVPLWAWLSALAFFLFIILIAGAIIGGILRHKGHDDDDDNKYTNSTTPLAQLTTTATPTKTVTSPTQLVDAEPVTATPSYVVPLPAGVFQLDTGDPTGAFAGCLPKEEVSAWSCWLPTDKLTIELDTTGPAPMLSLMPTDSDVWYGVQPPYIQSQPLSLVFDKQTPGSPMAYQFQTLYKKRVVLAQSRLNFNNTGMLSARGFEPDFDQMPGFPWGMQEKALHDVDEPWFCEWPQTFLEVMIYVGNGSQVLTNGSTTVPPVTSMPATSQPGSKTSGSSSPYPANQKRGYPPSSASSSTPSGSSSYAGYSPPPAAPAASPSLFPQMVKIEERRLVNDQGTVPMPPTCTQMTRASNSMTHYNPKIINSNQILVFKLNESSPAIPHDQLVGHANQQPVRRDIPQDFGCYCAWNSPNGRAPPVAAAQAQYSAIRSAKQDKALQPSAKVKRWWLDEV